VISIARSGGIGVRGLSLTFVYVVAVTIAVSAFTALSFQNEIRGREINGQPFTVGRLTALIPRLKTHEDRVAQARQAVADAERALAEAEAIAFGANSQMRLLATEMQRLNRSLEAELSRLKGGLPELPEAIARRIPQYAAMLEEIGTDQRATAEQVFGEFTAKSDEYFTFEAQYEDSHQRLDFANKNVTEARELLAGIEKEVIPLEGELTDLRQQIEFF
jgi:chromosome segregation ATPase